MARRIRFCTDEHFGRAVVQGLRQRGVDVVTTPESGMLGASDEEHLRRASAEGRVMVTQDDDFLRLHATGVEHAGIVYAQPHTPVGEIVRGLMLVYEILEPEEIRGRLEFL